jgi:hypothetical protein
VEKPGSNADELAHEVTFQSYSPVDPTAGFDRIHQAVKNCLSAPPSVLKVEGGTNVGSDLFRNRLTHGHGGGGAKQRIPRFSLGVAALRSTPTKHPSMPA